MCSFFEIRSGISIIEYNGNCTNRGWSCPFCNQKCSTFEQNVPNHSQSTCIYILENFTKVFPWQHSLFIFVQNRDQFRNRAIGSTKKTTAQSNYCEEGDHNRSLSPLRSFYIPTPKTYIFSTLNGKENKQKPWDCTLSDCDKAKSFIKVIIRKWLKSRVLTY